jgi:hypothetical protein
LGREKDFQQSLVCVAYPASEILCFLSPSFS